MMTSILANKVIKNESFITFSREFCVYGRYIFGNVSRWSEYTDGSIRCKALLTDGRTIFAQSGMGHMMAVREDITEEDFFAGKHCY